MFDINSLSRVRLNELLEDHKKDLNSYMARRTLRKRKVNARAGTVDRFETPLGMSADQQRQVKHAAGAPTPVGNAEMGTREYRIESFSWAESIDHLAEKELKTVSNALSEFTGSTSHTVLGALDRDFADVLGGNGSAGTFDNVTTDAVGVAWDSSASVDIVSDVDDAVSLLRPGSRGLTAYCGFDIAQIMSKNEKVINHADKSHTTFGGVIAFLRDRGITQVYIDIGPEQDGERESDRSYKGIFDGIFTITTADNLILVEMNDLAPDAYYDKSRRTNYLRSAGDWDIITGYPEHTIAFTNLKS